MLKSKVEMSGKLTICIRGADGRIKDRETFDNLVVTTGREHIADQLSGIIQGAMTHMGIGTGTTEQLATDTTLSPQGSGTNEITPRHAFTSKEQGTGGNSNQVIYVADWVAGEGDGAIAEAGIFNSLSGGVMLCRTTFPVKNKGAGDSLTLTWTISIAAS